MNCDALHIPGLPDGALQKSCIATNLSEGYDAQGNPIAGATPAPTGSSFFGIPLPGSSWTRHMMFRAGEIIVGIAMIIVGIKSFTSGNQTINVITKATKKAYG